MFFSRLLGGLTGGNITVAQAYISDVTDAENRAKGLGLIGAAFGLGFILGPVAGGALSAFGYDVPSFAAAALAMVNLVAVIFFLPESLTRERREELMTERRSLISLGAMWEALNKPLVGPLLNIRLFYALAAAIFQTIFTQWAMVRLGLSAQATGWLLGYVGLLSIIVQGGLIGPLTKRFPEYQLIFWSTGIMAVSLLAWGLTPNLPLLLIVMIPIAFATGVLNTVINAAITRSVQPQEIGGALGIAGSLESLSRIISPLLGSFLLGAVGTWAPGVAASLIMAWVVFYAWRHLIVRPDAPLVMGAARSVSQSHK
jgi:MFS transporter, DHA1 family, tetracycline resistance protein